MASQYITASTTYSKVDSVQTPNTLRLLSTISYTGQLVSVFDATNSPTLTQYPIVLSTQRSTFFNDSSFSTLINQPQGFITAQAVNSNTWSIVNSFPFRNNSTSIHILNVSTIYAGNVSTTIDILRTLNVENLTIIGPINQRSSINIDNSITVYGNLRLESSFSVWDNLVVNQVSSFSSVIFASSLTTSTINTLLLGTSGHASISSGLTAQSLSSPLIQVTGSVNAQRTEVQSSTINVLIGGSLIANHISTNNLDTGGNINIYESTTIFGQMNLLKDLYIGSNLTNTFSSLTTNALFTQGPLYTSSLRTSDGTFNTLSFQSLTLNGSFNLTQPLTVSSLVTNSLSTISTLTTGFATVSNLSTLGNVITTTSALSTTDLIISSSLSTFNNLAIFSDLTSQGNLLTYESLSSQQSFWNGRNTAILGSLSTGSNVFISTTTFVKGNLHTMSPLYIHGTNTLFLENVSTTSNFIVSGITEMANFTLGFNDQVKIISTRSVYVENFLSTGFIHVQGSSFISSIDLGVAPFNYVFHTSNIQQFGSLFVSTAVSTQSVILQSNAPFTNFYSSFTVRTSSINNIFNVGVNSYYSDTLYTQGSISANTLFADAVYGTFIGDGSQLSNFYIQGDIRVQTYSVGASTYTSSLFVNKNLVITNEGTVDAPLNVTDGGIVSPELFDSILFQNNNPTYPSRGVFGTSSIYATLQIFDDSLLRINNVLYISTSRVGINISTPEYELHVKDTLQVKGLVGPVLNFRSMRIDSLYLSSITDRGSITYISSGRISTGNLMILPDETSITPYLSVNRIQTLNSTLGLNEFVFLNQSTQTLGIGTSNPRYSLDVPSLHCLSSFTSEYTEINAGLFISTNLSSIWVATAPNDPVNLSNYHNLSNFLYSVNNGNNFIPGNDSEEWNPSPGATYNGNYWVALGNPMKISYDGISWIRVDTLGGYGGFDTSQYGKAAWNGRSWIAVGKSIVSGTTYTSSLLLSDDGIHWSGLATNQFVSSTVSQGNDIIWIGNQWVATGFGSSTQSTILRSVDGSNWLSTSNGFSKFGTGLSLGPQYNNVKTLFAVGGDPGTGSIKITSDSQIDWFNILSGGFSFGGNAIASDGNYVIAVGSDWQSRSNIQVWAPSVNTTLSFTSYESFTGKTILNFSNNGNDVSYGASEWLLAGNNGMRKLITTPDVALSSFTVDGQSTMMYIVAIDVNNVAKQPIRTSYGFFSPWSYTSDLDGFINYNVETNGSNMWVLVGYSTDVRCMYNSTDAVHWRVLTTASNGVPTLGTQGVQRIAFQNGIWFATGYDNSSNYNSAWYSYDGVQWYSFPMWRVNCTAVLYGNNIWVTIGGSLVSGSAAPGDPGYANVYWNSNFDPDPSTWTRASNTTPNIKSSYWNYRFFPNGSYSAMFTGSYFYMGGNSKGWDQGGSDPGQAGVSLIYSGDGKSWSNQYYEDNMAISYDPFIFGSPGRNIGTVTFDSVNSLYILPINGLSIVLCNSYQIWYSSNGINNWLPVTNCGPSRPAIAANNSMRSLNGFTIACTNYGGSAPGDDRFVPFWYSRNGSNWFAGPTFTENFNATPLALANIALVPVPLYNNDIYSVSFSLNLSPRIITSNLSIFTDENITGINQTTSTNTIIATSSRMRFNELFQVTPRLISFNNFIESSEYTQRSMLLIANTTEVTDSITFGVLYISSINQSIQIA